MYLDPDTREDDDDENGGPMDIVGEDFEPSGGPEPEDLLYFDDDDD